MKPLAVLLGLGLAVSLTAQSPLNTIMTGGNTLGTGGAVLFVQMTSVASSITINRIDCNVNAAVGTHGRLRVWQTLTGFPSFSGSETVAANWQLLGEGYLVAAGANVASICAFETPITITSAMGPRGYAFEHIGVGANYTNGNGANQNYANADMTLTAGAAGAGSPYADATGPLNAGGINPFFIAVNQPRVFNGAIHYAVGPTAPVLSFSNRVGQACGGTFGSAFDINLTPALASPKLTGRQVMFVPNGVEYTVLTSASPGLVPYATHLPLSGWASTIPGAVPTDDGEVVVPLTTPFTYPAGVASSLVVHNGGMISVASNLAFIGTLGGLDWAPTVTGMLAMPNATWFSWHDMDITTAGSVTFAEIGTVAVFTWVGVPSFGGLVTNTSTFQFTFDSSTGVVTIAWETVEAVGVPNPIYSGQPWLVGYSPGGASIRPDPEMDVSVDATSNLGTPEAGNLTLSSAPRPTFGSIIDYNVQNLNAVVPIGFLYFSAGNPFNPGLPLSFIGVGKPGCFLNFDLANAIGPFSFVAPGLVLSIDTNTVTPSMLGLDFWGQAVVFDFAAFDLFASLISSNALHQRVETN